MASIAMVFAAFVIMLSIPPDMKGISWSLDYDKFE
jgi:hypothetical protein